MDKKVIDFKKSLQTKEVELKKDFLELYLPITIHSREEVIEMFKDDNEEELSKLAGKYGITIDELLGEWQKDYTEVKKPTPEMKKEMERLLMQYDRKQDMIGIWINKFKEEYDGKKDINEFAEELLDEIVKGIGYR